MKSTWTGGWSADRRHTQKSREAAESSPSPFIHNTLHEWVRECANAYVVPVCVNVCACPYLCVRMCTSICIRACFVCVCVVCVRRMPDPQILQLGAQLQRCHIGEADIYNRDQKKWTRVGGRGPAHKR
jgi:hypothetical protein